MKISKTETHHKSMMRFLFLVTVIIKGVFRLVSIEQKITVH
jgi:hypothetical protein